MGKFLGGVAVGLVVSALFAFKLFMDNDVGRVITKKYTVASALIGMPITCQYFITEMVGGEVLYLTGYSENRKFTGGIAGLIVEGKQEKLDHWGKYDHKGSLIYETDSLVARACNEGAQEHGLNAFIWVKN